VRRVDVAARVAIARVAIARVAVVTRVDVGCCVVRARVAAGCGVVRGSRVEGAGVAAALAGVAVVSPARDEERGPHHDRRDDGAKNVLHGHLTATIPEPSSEGQ
jgi:hypothetical protein